MGRKKKIEYTPSIFATRITELQNHYNYSDSYVCNHLLNEKGYPLITEIQTLNNYKIGKRMPRDFFEVVVAFAKFYHVTTDYLLGMENTPNHNVEKVTTYTGLCSDAVNKLVKIKQIRTKYPNILHMVESLLIGSSDTDISLLIDLYTRILDDYKDEKASNTASTYDLEKMQHRILVTQQLYNHISHTLLLPNIRYLH